MSPLQQLHTNKSTKVDHLPLLPKNRRRRVTRKNGKNKNRKRDENQDEVKEINKNSGQFDDAAEDKIECVGEDKIEGVKAVATTMAGGANLPLEQTPAMDQQQE